MSSRILVKSGEKTTLKRMFETSYPAVQRALSGQTETDLAKRIRKAALQRGGVEEGRAK
jgi:hypothetical protein